MILPVVIGHELHNYTHITLLHSFQRVNNISTEPTDSVYSVAM